MRPEDISAGKSFVFLVLGTLVFTVVLLGVALGSSWLMVRVVALSLFEGAILFFVAFVFAIYWRHETEMPLLAAVLLLVFFLAWGIGLGWLAIRWLPFSLFQSALLCLVATFTLFYAFFMETAAVREQLELEDDWLHVDAPIELERFMGEAGKRTGDVWFRYVTANAIYEELTETPRLMGSMGEPQAQELAMRLAEVSTAVLQRKPNNTRTFRITRAALQKQMGRMKQRPYDDDLLDLTVNVINEQIETDMTLQMVAQNRLWRHPFLPDEA